MRVVLTGMAVAALWCAPIAAADTLDDVTTHGIVATVSGFDVDVSFSADHRFTMLNGVFVGVWRIDGTRLCLTGDNDHVEKCTDYPTGKHSGDTFQVQGDNGPMTVHIR